MATEESVENSAQALVSLKEGKGAAYGTPQRRGHPTRIRQRNRRFFNDEEETDLAFMRSPKKQAKTSALQASYARHPLSTGPDKRLAHTIGARLRNLLKLPKAHKWVCYEWFYSNIDAPLFLGENDFCACLKESFPNLKTKMLRRSEWCKIRRLMGKPRRCSPAFFAEERAALQEKREKIRLLQQRKLTDISSLKDLPDEIPLHLVIGTKVTARLRKPQDGIFTGTVEALDTTDSTYRVTFDRPGLGTHSIPDYEVLSNEPAETIPLSAFQQKHRPRGNFLSPPKFVPGLSSPGSQLDSDPLLTGSPFKGGRLLSLEGGTYGGFPIRFLVLVTKLSKILNIKKDLIQQLKDMNGEAERLNSYLQPITVEFKKKYARLILDIDEVNKDLTEYLTGVQDYCLELAPEQGPFTIEQPLEIRRKCEEEAEAMTHRLCQTMFHNRKTAKNDKILELITNLTALMLQIKTLTESDLNSYEFKSLQDSIKDMKDKLDGNNINCFQNNVEIHINHIHSGLSQMGNLHAFASSSYPS